MTIQFSAEDISKLKHAIETGVTTKREIKDLNESLGEVLTEVCKELNIPKSLVNQAIKMAFKASQQGSKDAVIEEEQTRLDTIDNLLSSISSSKTS